MELVLRFLGLQFTVYLGPEEVAEADNASLGAADLSFGFGPDPVFPLLDWGDDDG